MVKGNWERRVERAAKQKAAKRDAAAAKAKGQLVDPLDILNAIFLKDPDASVWVAGQGNKLCAAYFRNGDCPNRRCKWSHAETLAPWNPSSTDATTEAPVEQVQTVAARLDGAVPKAEFNDGSVLAPVPEGVVARVLSDERTFELRPHDTGVGGGGVMKSLRLGSSSVFQRGNHSSFRFRVLGASEQALAWVRAVETHSVSEQVRKTTGDMTAGSEESGSVKASAFSCFRGGWSSKKKE